MKKYLVALTLGLFTLTGCASIEAEMQWDAIQSSHNRWRKVASDDLDFDALEENDRQRRLENKQLRRLIKWHNKNFK